MITVNGKRVLITGVADEICFNVVLTLAKQGCRLVLAGDATQLRGISDQITSVASATSNDEFRGVELIELDFSAGEKGVGVTIEKICQTLGGLDAFISCSTYTGPLTSFLDTTEDQWEYIIGVNFKHVCLLSKAVGKCMRDNGTKGSIIFITSIIGIERGLFPGVAIPGASLAAVNHLTRALAIELGKYKIQVNAVARGLFESDSLLKSMSREAREKEAQRIIPLQRWLDTRGDLSSIIQYLVADSSLFITGSVIVVDGGQSLTRPRLRSFI